jgi:hypothetical protein
MKSLVVLAVVLAALTIAPTVFGQVLPANLPVCDMPGSTQSTNFAGLVTGITDTNGRHIQVAMPGQTIFLEGTNLQQTQLVVFGNATSTKPSEVKLGEITPITGEVLTNGKASVAVPMGVVADANGDIEMSLVGKPAGSTSCRGNNSPVVIALAYAVDGKYGYRLDADHPPMSGVVKIAMDPNVMVTLSVGGMTINLPTDGVAFLGNYRGVAEVRWDGALVATFLVAAPKPVRTAR